MSNKNVFGGLGLLDFLAYYIPGAVVVAIAVVVNEVNGIKFPDPIKFCQDPKNFTYINGVVWTTFTILVPYLAGHIIFPIGYLMSYLIRKIRWFRLRTPKRAFCNREKDQPYCTVEDSLFASCLLNATNNSAGTFDNLMITRFRALSRFSRSMLFPSILLAGLGVDLFFTLRLDENKSKYLILLVVGLGSAVGFWYRHRNYEVRWRNGICVAAHPEMAGTIRLMHP
jgi:hypothetical protein